MFIIVKMSSIILCFFPQLNDSVIVIDKQDDLKCVIPKKPLLNLPQPRHFSSKLVLHSFTRNAKIKGK